MKKHRYVDLALVSLTSLALPAFGADEPFITITGFGTAALTMTNTNEAEFVSPPQAAGAKKRPRTGVDSKFGIQGTAKLTDQLSFIAQGLASKTKVDSYGAELTWAFLKYKVSDDLTLRIGRTTPPIYMISDFRHVGYANVMIRQPSEVYRQVPITSINGVDLIYRHSFDDTTVTAQLGYGKVKHTIPDAYLDYKSMVTLHVVAENGPFTFRYGHTESTFSYHDNAVIGLLNALRGVGQAGVANALNPFDLKGKFDSLGFGLDYKDVVVQAEYAKRKINSRLLQNTTAWYTMLGYRYGKVTPYYVHGSVMQDSPRSFPELPTTGPLAPLSAAANGAARAAQQTSNAIGVRWDFARSAALKVQMDRVSPVGGTGGTSSAFIKRTATFTGPVNVYAAGIDFVF